MSLGFSIRSPAIQETGSDLLVDTNKLK
jgi:hypothetical protein